MSWWRRNWRWLLAVLLTGLASAAVIALVVVRKNKQVDELKAKLALSRAAAKVAGLEADKKARATALAVNEEQAKALETEILQAKKTAVAVVESVDAMSDTEVLVAFKKLGY